MSHYNTLQLTALHCNTLQHTATHCNTLQHAATRCNTLPNSYRADFCDYLPTAIAQCVLVSCSVSATHCKTATELTSANVYQLPLRRVLQCFAACCSVLQCVATYCKKPRELTSANVHQQPLRSGLQCVALCCSVL